MSSLPRSNRRRQEARGTKQEGAAFLFAAAVLAIAPGLTAAESAAVRVERIDGTIIEASWIGLDDGRAISLATEKSTLRVGLDELFSLVFAGRDLSHSLQPARTFASDGSSRLRFYLADGGLLTGELLGSAPAALVARTVLGEQRTFPFDRLAGIQLADVAAFPRCSELFQAALDARLPAKDVLITRSVDEPRSLRGRLEELDAERGAFTLGDKTRTFSTDRIYGIVFAGGSPELAKYPVTCELADGARFSGRLVHGDRVHVRVGTSLGFEADISIETLTSLRFHSTRVVYVSDLTPVNERSEGQLHRPWPFRPDANVAAGPISIGGRGFRKGLGVHSRSELTYSLAGEYEAFAAAIGLDDRVRPKGSVVFRVLDDRSPAEAKVLFDSGPVTGTDAPRNVLVDVRGVDRLTLVVGFGEGLDLSDHADWGGARLIRPAPPPASGGSAAP